jgi:LCP family protein required for cell wall assembly
MPAQATDSMLRFGATPGGRLGVRSSQPPPTMAAPPRAATSLPALAVAAALSKPTVAPATLPVTPVPTLPTSRLPIDMDLPGENSPSHFDLTRRRAKWRGLRRGTARGLAVALVLLITMGGLLFSQSYLKLHKVFKGGTGTAAALKANVNPDLLKGEGTGRVNILLLGRGGGNHDGPDLTDTMMLASIDPVNHTSVLLSIPRDLWVNVPNQGVMKINAAWETGEFKYLGKGTTGSTNPKAIKAGFDLVDQTVEGVLGITIDYNMMVDFQAFQQAVDTVGGVTVNAPTDLVDPTMAWENAGNPTLATAGVQNFDGKHALIYVRSRETTSDFARAERQRSVLLALKGKIETLGTISNPLKLSGLLNTFGNNVQTDLSLSNASRLYSILKGVGGGKVLSIGLSDTAAPGATPYVIGGNINGQSIVLPKAGLFQYGAIQQFVRGQLKDPYILRENAKIIVLNGTTIPGLATAKADELRSYGYNVARVGNTPSSGWTQTTLVDLSRGKDKYTKHYLEQRFNTTASTTLSDTTIPTNGADFVIIIGSDEANTTITQP